MLRQIMAAIEHDGDCGQFPRLNRPCDCGLERRVRAALKVMREPTERMVRAAHDADGNWGEAETHAEAWRTMIDYILVAENAD